MAKQSKFQSIVTKMREQYADQGTDWFAAIAFDNTSGIYTWPVIGSLFEFLRPNYAVLASQDKLIFSKMSDKQESQPIILNRADVQDLKFKKGVVESSMTYLLKDGSKFGITMFRKQPGASEEYMQAFDLMSNFK